MDLWIISCVLFLASVCKSEVNVSLDFIDDYDRELRVGDSVVIRCEIQGLEPLSTLRILRQVNGRGEEIVTNCQKGRYFQDLARYEVTRCDNDVDTKRRTVEVTITGLQGEDGGDIGCKCLCGPESPSTSFSNIFINVPLESLDFMYMKEGKMVALEDGVTSITLDENHEVVFACQVNVVGSDDGPETFTLGFSDLQVGDLISKHPHNTSETLHDGLLQASFTQLIEYRSDITDLRLNNQALTCDASKTGYQTLTKSAVIEVRYQPKIRCEEHHHHDKTQPNMTVSCSAHMHPQPLHHQWSWIDGSDNQTLTEGESMGKYSSEHTSQGGDWHQFSLNVNNVTSDDYRRYTLQVTNEVGVGQHSLHLHEAVVSTESPTTTKVTEPTTTNSQRTTKNKVVDDGSDSGAEGRHGLYTSVLLCWIACHSLVFM